MYKLDSLNFTFDEPLGPVVQKEKLRCPVDSKFFHSLQGVVLNDDF